MWKPSLRGLALIALSLTAYSVTTLAQSARPKPQPPMGIDPGGVTIGLLTTGIDYTSQPVFRCLARDGEGRVIAWDVVDRDPLPYKPHSTDAFDDDALASGIDCAGRVRIVPVRVDPKDPVSISRALAFLATTPARIVVLPARNTPGDWRPFLAAVVEFRHLLVVVATTSAVATHPAANQSNVALVSAASIDEASRLALGDVVLLIACDARARDTSMTGAARAGLLAEQAARLSTLPTGGPLSPKCR